MAAADALLPVGCSIWMPHFCKPPAQAPQKPLKQGTTGAHAIGQPRFVVTSAGQALNLGLEQVLTQEPAQVLLPLLICVNGCISGGGSYIKCTTLMASGPWHCTFSLHLANSDCMFHQQNAAQKALDASFELLTQCQVPVTACRTSATRSMHHHFHITWGKCPQQGCTFDSQTPARHTPLTVQRGAFSEVPNTFGVGFIRAEVNGAAAADSWVRACR